MSTWIYKLGRPDSGNLIRIAFGRLDDVGAGVFLASGRRVEPSPLLSSAGSASRSEERPDFWWSAMATGPKCVNLYRQMISRRLWKPDWNRSPTRTRLCAVNLRRRGESRGEGDSEKAGSDGSVRGRNRWGGGRTALRLGSFSSEEVAALYHQHTEATGQRFEEPAIPFAWESTEVSRGL